MAGERRLLGLGVCRGGSILMQDCTKEWRRAEAKVRRICKPTSRSRNVAASPDIVSRWDAGGDVRNDLIRAMMKSDGNKDCVLLVCTGDWIRSCRDARFMSTRGPGPIEKSSGHLETHYRDPDPQE